MQPLRMVPLASLGSQFEAQVLTARLGAEGVVCQVRGACSVYPLGGVDVLVDACDLERARELLLVDEVESVFEPAPPPHDRLPVQRHGWLAWLAATAVLAAVGLRLLSALWS